MLAILCFTAFIGLSVQQCCFPSQWEGTEGGNMVVIDTTTHKPILTEFAYKVSLDYTNHFLSASGTVTSNGQPTQIRYIRDYKNGLQYTLIVDTGKCTKETVAVKELTCIGAQGDNSTKSGDFTLGAGGESMKFTGYGNKIGDMYYSTSVSEGCIPVGMTFHGRNEQGAATAGLVGFTNITPGIADLSVFAVPAQCVVAPLKGAGSPDIFGKRSIY